MGNFPTAVKLSAALLLSSCLVDYARAAGTNLTRECVESQDGCRRCRGDVCARCAVLLHAGTCVDACPAGHTADWSTRDEYMGRICRETGYVLGLTGSQVAILVGVVSGATICVFIVLCGVAVLHRRKRRAAKIARQYEDSAERKEFLKHLATLRGEANTFLSMLNDTRRQVRELYYSGSNGDGAVGIQAYRPVLRDLARILVLVNRRDEEIPVPPDDWQRLFSWAERLLRRYKRHSSPEVAQLVTFLQQPPGMVAGIGPATSAPGSSTSVQSPTGGQHHQQRQHQQRQQHQQPIKITPTTSPAYEPRATPTNLTTFQANIPLATFQASDKSSISPPGSSIGGYAKPGTGNRDDHDDDEDDDGGDDNSPASSRREPNGGRVSRNGSAHGGPTTPLVAAGVDAATRRHGNPRRVDGNHPTSSAAACGFDYDYGFEESWLAAGNFVAKDRETTTTTTTTSGLDREISPKWEFQAAVEAANYSIVADWSPGRDYFVDDFTILGFRPQDEITTEL